jgi:copper chaperone
MTISTFEVAGMTCGHCVASVSQEVRKIAGVSAVDIALVPGGKSTVSVNSESPVDVDDVRDAVDEAGYELISP